MMRQMHNMSTNWRARDFGTGQPAVWERVRERHPGKAWAGLRCRLPAALAFASLLPAQTPAQLDGYLGVPNARAESAIPASDSLFVTE